MLQECSFNSCILAASPNKCFFDAECPGSYPKVCWIFGLFCVYMVVNEMVE